ncbi:hypothetical protein SCACP_01300 [Sporomusa carbonis]|uniref:histidine kinase n=1 Tax=Sporomusa carbonis TaxID=3076075 RepID=UPI003A73E677
MDKNIIKAIEETFNLNVIGDQYFNWGEQHWLQLAPTSPNTQPTVSVAIVYPGKEHASHVHSGYEEIIIGLEGEIVHWCDEREIRLHKGTLGYISDGSRHRIVNSTPSTASFLSIVYPTIPKALGEIYTVEDIELKEVAKIINLDIIAEQFAETVRMAVTLVDVSGDLLTMPRKLPEFCMICMHEKCGDCILSSPENIKIQPEQKLYHCKFGVASIQCPIIVNRRVLGYLGCGYGLMYTGLNQEAPEMFNVFSGQNHIMAQNAYINLPLINRNHMNSVADTLRLVSASLVQLMINSIKEKRLSSYQVSLSEERQKQAQLSNSLNQARLKFLESQVNPHFLFNTLNIIAQQAEMDGASTLASLTYALSNLLRLSLGKTDSLVTIREELNCIEDYLFIQKNRFPDKFDVDIQVEQDILDVKAPFMIIMVLVENAILHGFTDILWRGKLIVRGYKHQQTAVLEVIDNGCGIAPEVVDAIRDFPKSEYDPAALKGIGLKNIYMRLRHYYGDAFEFVIERLPEKGTKARICLPL